MSADPAFREVHDGDVLPREAYDAVGQLDPVALIEWFCPGIGRERAERIAEAGEREMTPISVGSLRSLILMHWRDPDPTRLDPPIEFEVTAAIPPVPAIRAVIHLERLRGYTGGRTSDPTPEDRAAEDRLFRAHRLRILVTHIDAEGRPTFELAPRDA